MRYNKNVGPLSKIKISNPARQTTSDELSRPSIHQFSQSRVKNNGYIKFTLLDKICSALIKEIALLNACTESSEVLLSQFKHHLPAGNGRLIQHGDEDVVYIGNHLLAFPSAEL
jgi:hypothetical protein